MIDLSKNKKALLQLPKPKAVIFDWDNTLVDTWPLIHEAIDKTMGDPEQDVNRDIDRAKELVARLYNHIIDYARSVPLDRSMEFQKEFNAEANRNLIQHISSTV